MKLFCFVCALLITSSSAFFLFCTIIIKEQKPMTYTQTPKMSSLNLCTFCGAEVYLLPIFEGWADCSSRKFAYFPHMHVETNEMCLLPPATCFHVSCLMLLHEICRKTETTWKETCDISWYWCSLHLHLKTTHFENLKEAEHNIITHIICITLCPLTDTTRIFRAMLLKTWVFMSAHQVPLKNEKNAWA